MKNRFYVKPLHPISLLITLLVFSFVLTDGSGFPESAMAGAESVNFDKASPQIKKTIEVQNRHSMTLMAIPEVVGNATGIDKVGNTSVLVFVKSHGVAEKIPLDLEGVPVKVDVTGEFFAFKKSLFATKTKINPTTKFTRPVPIGISTGNEGECSSGTIGARVTDGINVYALSNNHVYALENSAPIGSKVLQPGLYDTSCIFYSNNVIGTLYAFVPIDFSGGNNTVDAAIALTSKALLQKFTPSNGYGIPKSKIVTASPGQEVQKYGRTTSLTDGMIAGINATINVSYKHGIATFVNQIVISSEKPFVKPGDSGSLLVTNSGANPVGLLFAGNSSGTYSVANRIEDVLSSFGITIDGN